MIGLSGAERVGKSSLAKLYADATGITYQPFNTIDVINAMGIDITKPMEIETRIELQEGILAKHIKEVQQAPAACITDRTTFDFAAYMMLDIAKTCPRHLEDRVTSYVNKCFEVANSLYFGVVIVQPGIPYLEAEGKPLASTTRQEAMNTLILGLVNDPRFTNHGFYLRRDLLDLEGRVLSLGKIWQHLLAAIPPVCEATRH